MGPQQPRPPGLTGLMRAAFGPGRRPVDVTRLRGGSKKGVYRVAFSDGFTAIAYIWDPSEDYWQAASAARSPGDHADPFAHASGLDLFTSAQQRLDALGVRTPRLYLADRGQFCPADAAVIEDVPGPDLETLLEAGDQRAGPAVAELGRALAVMHADTAPAFGKAGHVRAGGTSTGGSCEQVVLHRALAHLDEAAARVPRIGAARARLADALHARAAPIRPRADYSLIHGELGPDHVLVDGAGHPVIIDIEGLMYFDAEWEHVFLALRFGRYYPALRDAAGLGAVPADSIRNNRGLDGHRLDFYQLAMHLSLIAGPMRILDGDYPERGPMLQIAVYNTDRALALI